MRSEPGAAGARADAARTHMATACPPVQLPDLGQANRAMISPAISAPALAGPWELAMLRAAPPGRRLRTAAPVAVRASRALLSTCGNQGKSRRAIGLGAHVRRHGMAPAALGALETILPRTGVPAPRSARGVQAIAAGHSRWTWVLVMAGVECCSGEDTNDRDLVAAPSLCHLHRTAGSLLSPCAAAAGRRVRPPALAGRKLCCPGILILPIVTPVLVHAAAATLCLSATAWEGHPAGCPLAWQAVGRPGRAAGARLDRGD